MPPYSRSKAKRPSEGLFRPPMAFRILGSEAPSGGARYNDANDNRKYQLRKSTSRKNGHSNTGYSVGGAKTSRCTHHFTQSNPVVPQMQGDSGIKNDYGGAAGLHSPRRRLSDTPRIDNGQCNEESKLRSLDQWPSDRASTDQLTAMRSGAASSLTISGRIR